MRSARPRPRHPVRSLALVLVACSGNGAGRSATVDASGGSMNEGAGGRGGAAVNAGGASGRASGGVESRAGSSSIAGRGGSGAGGAPIYSSAGRGGALVLLKPQGGAGGALICGELNVTPKPVVPTVMILVDNSSSMFEPREQLWDVLYTSLMHPTTGVVKPLEAQLRFGFASYKGLAATPTGNDPACAKMTTVPYALNNYQKIDEVYQMLGMGPITKWETPTGFAIDQVSAELAELKPDPPGPKYILLVTDGNPNLCQLADPQCGQDIAIKAVQDAKAKGIGTYAIGMGEIAGSCDTQAGRCGIQHLQDIANAGQGLPVEPPPDAFLNQPCASFYNRTLQATYAPAGQGAMAPYFTASSGTELKTALENLLKSVVSCTFDMDAVVTGNPALGKVVVGGSPVTYSDLNGWRLETNKYQVTLQGSACESFKTGSVDVRITFPCDPITGMPIAVKR